MKSSATHQKARLLTALASLNSGHNSDLCAYYVGMRSLSRPNLVPTRPLHPRNATWRFSLVANLSNTVPKHALTAKAKARTIAGRYHMTTTFLAHNFIWPYNNSVLSHYTSSFSISPSLASKPVRRRLSLRSTYLGAFGPANHLTHILGHHHGPLGLLHKHNFGYDSHSHLTFHQLVDCKVVSNHKRHNVFDGRLHLGQPHVNK